MLIMIQSCGPEKKYKSISELGDGIDSDDVLLIMADIKVCSMANMGYYIVKNASSYKVYCAGVSDQKTQKDDEALEQQDGDE